MEHDTKQKFPYDDRFDRLASLIEQSNELLVHLIPKQDRAPKLLVEEVTFTDAPYTYDSRGYLYVGFVVGANATVHVRQRAKTFDLTLSAGFNQVHLIDSAELYTDTGSPVQATMIRSAYVFN